MNAVDRQSLVIEQLVPALEADGYIVYLRPSRQLLPPFMQGHVPDAIALGPRKKLAIEVIFDEPASKAKLDTLRRLFEGVSDWELRVLYSRAVGQNQAMPTASNAEIAGSIASIERLAADGQTGPALLIAWSTLEALGRTLLGKTLQGPQSADRLVEALAASGEVTPTEADLLRKLARLRNQLSHGELGIGIEPSRLSALIDILKTLHRSSEAAQIPS